MKAIAVYPRKPNSVHLEEIEKPSLDEIPDGRGILMKTISIGVDATDAEINEGLYGNPPEGDDFLVLGHESFGIVEAVGSAVTEVEPGDYISFTVRRPGGSIYDKIGRSDMTSEETYYERGINLRHGCLTEYVVDSADYVVRIPEKLKHIGVLAEPASVCAKAIEEAYQAQKRMQVWSPKIAFVMGSGQIGLLATLMLKLKGLDVYTLARSPKEGNLKAEIAEQYGATYVSTKETSVADLAAKVGRPDIIIESTGHSGVAFESMEVLNLNGACVWTSITGGDRKIEIPADKINLEWVLGNKLLLGSVNGNVDHFKLGIKYLALGEAMYPGVTERILTNPVDGLENYEELMRLLVEDKSALKVYMNI